jgi:hypothetical protein
VDFAELVVVLADAEAAFEVPPVVASAIEVGPFVVIVLFDPAPTIDVPLLGVDVAAAPVPTAPEMVVRPAAILREIISGRIVSAFWPRART